ncbi:MAG: RecX family transcriptional regulator [Stellaceae bacterium]
MTRQHEPGAPLTVPILEKAALRYLERYASSAETLRRVLLRRVARAVGRDEAAAEQGRALVETLIQRYLDAGLLDDRRYAAAKAASLARAGASRYRIRGTLLQKGVPAAEIATAVAALDAEDEHSELAAAAAFIRRKRLGPYRPVERRGALRQKDLATLARAGFALDLARRLLDAPDADALDRHVHGDES